MKKVISVFITGIAVMLSSICIAQQPTEMRDQAFMEVQRATELFNRANRLLSLNVGEPNLRQALQLYVEAGQLYERAANIFSALGAQYVNEEDMLGVNNAIKICVTAIQRTQQQLQVLQQRKLNRQ